MECPPETWLALDKCLADAVKDKFPRPNDQPPPPPQVAEPTAPPTAAGASPAPSSQRLGKRRQRAHTPLDDVKSEKVQDGDAAADVATPVPIKDDKKWQDDDDSLAAQHRRRKRRMVWTDEEEDAVRRGVARFGESSWTEIKLHYPNVLLHRTAEQIKDKYRNIQKRLSKSSSA